MKYIIFTLFLWAPFAEIVAQSLPPFFIQFDPCSECSMNNPQNSNYYLLPTIPSFIASDVSSDFGPRFLSSSHYDWHAGIDYSPLPGDQDIGYHIRAVVGGLIREVGVNGNLKYIVIDGEDYVGNEYDFGYLHIFTNLAPPTHNGNCFFVELTSPSDRFGILVPNDLGGYTLLSDCVDCLDHYYIHYGEIVFATNQVSQGQIIGVLGDSGTGDAHLHLSRYESIAQGTNFINNDPNGLNPLEVVNHSTPEYRVSIHNHSQNIADPEDEPEGIVLKYPGTQPTKAIVRPRMLNESENVSKYNFGIMNVSKVELLLKKTSEVEYTLIEGGSFLSVQT